MDWENISRKIEPIVSRWDNDFFDLRDLVPNVFDLFFDLFFWDCILE